MMTPDDQARWRRIENALGALAEGQAKHDESLTRIEVTLERSIQEHDLKIRQLTEFQSILMESQNKTWGAVGRLAEAQRATAVAQQATADAQKDTERKLKALIEIVNRILGRGNGKPLA